MSKSTQRAAVRNQRSAISVQRSADRAAHWAGGRRTGFTLTEVMIVIGIIAILVTVVAWAGSRLLSDAKVKQTRAILDDINVALTEYKLTHKDAPPQPFDPDDDGQTGDPYISQLEAGTDQFRWDFFREPSGTPGDYKVEGSGDPAASGKKVTSSPSQSPGTVAYSVQPKTSIAAKYEPDGKRVYGIQSLYYYLAKEPGAKRALEKIPKSCLGRGWYFDPVSGKLVPSTVEFGFQNAGAYMATGDPGRREWDASDATLPTRVMEVPILLDAWGRPLHYDADPSANNHQPAVVSAGPDGIFYTDDDVTSYGGK